MTAPSPDVRHLLDTLAPACTARNPGSDDECGQPARWLAHLTQRGRRIGHFLHCDAHRDRAQTHYRDCPGCRDGMGLAYRAEELT